MASLCTAMDWHAMLHESLNLKKKKKKKERISAEFELR